MMTKEKFYEIVRDMRESQKAYFKNRKKEDLQQSKVLERQVDAELTEFFDKGLF